MCWGAEEVPRLVNNSMSHIASPLSLPSKVYRQIRRMLDRHYQQCWLEEGDKGPELVVDCSLREAYTTVGASRPYLHDCNGRRNIPGTLQDTVRFCLTGGSFYYVSFRTNR